MKFTFTLAAAVAAILALGGCGSGGDKPATTTVAGQVQTLSTSCTAERMPASVYPGEQVSIVASNGNVLGSGTLGQPMQVSSEDGMPVCALLFSISGIPAQSLYGIRIASVSGTKWTKHALSNVVQVAPADL